MAENKFKYFTVTTTAIVKSPTAAEAQKIANSTSRKLSGVRGEFLFKDVEVERITAVQARKQVEA